jgi:hypothetical protein
MKIAIACLLLAGCATTLDPNYSMALATAQQAINAQATVEIAKARAEEARYNALAAIAETSDPHSRQMAIFALALNRGGEASGKNVAVNIPALPESPDDKALRWAAIFAAPVASLVQGFYGYRLGVTQSNNAAATTTASYNAFGNMATTGYNALGATTLAGYGTVQNIAGGALGVATDGINTLPQLRPVAPALPNLTINGNGVIGNGAYTGDNSGALSGNSGTIRVLSPDTTRNCTGTTNPAGTTNPTGTATANC